MDFCLQKACCILIHFNNHNFYSIFYVNKLIVFQIMTILCIFSHVLYFFFLTYCSVRVSSTMLNHTEASDSASLSDPYLIFDINENAFQFLLLCRKCAISFVRYSFIILRKFSSNSS